MSQQRQYHARAISMEFYNDSSDDEAILYEDDSDNEEDEATDRGSRSTNPHPITSFQEAFDESIADSAEQYRTGKPALELSSLSAEERRKRLLVGEDYNDTYSAMWREDPASRVHPLKKIVAQITYGVHLLHVQMAVSNEEVVKILQRHIDQVDELIRRADEDLGMALADIEMRISHLKFALADRTTFDVMLENRSYRGEILRGNDLIKDMIKRTESLMDDLLGDIKIGHDSIKEMSAYMGRIGSTWPMSTTDLGIYNTMLRNTEGWLECFDSLKLEGKSLSGCLMQLSALVEEMARRAENASRKQALTSKSNASLGVQSMNLPSFPTRQSSSSLSAKAIHKNSTPPLSTPGSITPEEKLTSSAYVPPRMPTDNINLPVRRKTNISERRATAISEKRSSTATIASLFIGVDDDDMPPEVPQVPQILKSKKSVKKSKIPKMPKMNRPRQISMSSITGRSGAGSQTQKDIRQDSNKVSSQAPKASTDAESAYDRDQTQPIMQNSQQYTEIRSPVLRALEQLSGEPKMKQRIQAPAPPTVSIPTPSSIRDAQLVTEPISASNRAISPNPSLDSYKSSPEALIPPRPLFVESPVLGYSGNSSPGLVSSPMRSSPSHSPAPSIVVRRKPLPNSAATSAVPTPRIQHSPQPSTTVQPAAKPSVIVNGNLTPELEPPQTLHKHQPSKSSLLTEKSQARPISADSSISESILRTTKTAESIAPSIQPSSPRSRASEPIDVLVPHVLPLLDDPIDLELAPLTSRRYESSLEDSPVIQAQTKLSRASTSSDDSYESSIVPLSELAHPFRSISPPATAQARSDSPAEGLGIDFPIEKMVPTAEETQNEVRLQPQTYTSPEALVTKEPATQEPMISRKIPMPQEMIIEEEPEPESADQSVKSQSPSRSISSAVGSLQTSPQRPVAKETSSPKAVDASIGAEVVRAATATEKHTSPTKVTASRVFVPQPVLAKTREVYQPKVTSKADSPLETLDGAAEPFTISFERGQSPLPFLHSEKQSPCHSANLSIASNIHKALPAIPRELSDYNLSPPQSPAAPSFFSSFSLGKASDSGAESITHVQAGRRTDMDVHPPLKSHPPKSIDTKIDGMRAMSPFGPDSGLSTGTFASSLREESIQRPQTARSLKPSRSKLALFPHTSPSMLDLRTKSDMALAGVERSMMHDDEDEAEVGEEADSALPPHPYAPPRLVPRVKDGGRHVNSNGGMQKVGTKLKNFFGRRGQKVQ